ncbi:hypothetical protein Fmac_023344 [Flemingia macrophylla]|uniref:BPL/LPL catalytic domain-containing protein n=1 Tax=Flemingia macrophylla TaxID=520843 RepID=A0ABD1LLB3_9FABA
MATVTIFISTQMLSDLMQASQKRKRKTRMTSRSHFKQLGLVCNATYKEKHVAQLQFFNLECFTRQSVQTCINGSRVFMKDHEATDFSITDTFHREQCEASARKAGPRLKTLEEILHSSVFATPPYIHWWQKANCSQFVKPQSELEKVGAELHYTQRGRDITFHGPHQAILYPIESFCNMGLSAWNVVEKIELTMIELTALYGVKAYRGQSGETMAFNIDPDLS